MFLQVEKSLFYAQIYKVFHFFVFSDQYFCEFLIFLVHALYLSSPALPTAELRDGCRQVKLRNSIPCWVFAKAIKSCTTLHIREA
jgi:hypothetical protein